MWQHVVRRDDGGPGLSIKRGGGVVTEAAASAPSPDQIRRKFGDFFCRKLQGSASRKPALMACRLQRRAMRHPPSCMTLAASKVSYDGLDDNGLPILGQEYMQCSAQSECRMLR